jgi:hypothetical protein
MTHEEFSRLNYAEEKKYLLAELKSILDAETAANKELEDAIGVLLPNMSERLLKIFK